MGEPRKILIVASECTPFSRSGGVADTVAGLAMALQRGGVDVRIILPLYRDMAEHGLETTLLRSGLQVPLAGVPLIYNVREACLPEGGIVYFIERDDMFNRPSLYSDALGEYYDNCERFAFFSRAALRAAEILEFRPDVIHCHDWQTGLVPALLKGPFRRTARLQGVPSLFTVHNVRYQGLFPKDKLAVAGLSEWEFFHPQGLEFWGKLSCLKAGMVYAEGITTPSPTYATEIMTSQGGMGLEGVAHQQRERLWGVTNGVDTRRWDPATDKHIAANFDAATLDLKKANKQALIQDLGLEPSLIDRPLLGFVSHLVQEKGRDILLDVLESLMDTGVGLIIQGTGDPSYGEALQSALDRYKGRISLTFSTDERLTHRIMAGADMLLLPASVEPCGSNQMVAMRYGTVPLARAAGSMVDTILDPGTDEGTGYLFKPFEREAFMAMLQRALDCYARPESWRAMMTRAMAQDFSWEDTANAYLRIYRTLMRG